MKKILYLSLVDWFWIKQRPHHIPEILSKNNKVSYFCSKPWRNNNYLKNSHSRDQAHFKDSHFTINENLDVYRKKFLPHKKFNKFIDPIYRTAKSVSDDYIKRFLELLDDQKKFDILFVTHPNQIDFIPKKIVDNTFVIYDCMDNFKKFQPRYENDIIQKERELLKICDVVTVSSSKLYKEIEKYNINNIKKKIFIINNGVDIERFNPNISEEESDITFFRNNDNKKVAYIGTVDKWVDLELIKKLAKNNKNIDFYVIGPVSRNISIDNYKEVENIIFTGVQPYDSIPYILSKIDVSIMPFKKNELVEAVNPVKIYESLAMGKPVIATRYQETEKFGEYIFTYENIEEFENILLSLINKKENPDIIQKRIEFAMENSWEKRVNEIESLWMNLT